MGLKDNAKALIDANVYANGQEQITGQGLNATLKGMVDILPTTEEIVSGVKGVATTSTVPSATEFERYIVHEVGTYTNFISGGSPIEVTAADLDVVNGVANNRVILEVNNGVATKRVERVKGDAAVANPTFNATNNSEASTMKASADFYNENASFRVESANASNINYTTADRTLTFSNTVYLVGLLKTQILATPKSVVLSSNSKYRIEYNFATNDIRAVGYNSAKTAGWALVGIVTASATGITTTDFAYYIDGKADVSYDSEYGEIVNSAPTRISFDTAEKKLTITSSRILSAGFTKSISASITIDFPTTSGAYSLVYNRVTDVLSWKAQSTVAAKNDIVLAYVTFAATTFKPTVTGISNYVIDGVNPNIVTPPVTKTVYKAELMPTTGTIDFNFVDSKITIPVTRIIVGSKSIVTTAQEVAITDTVWFKLMFNSDTKLFSIKKVTDNVDDGQNDIIVAFFHAPTRSVYGITNYAINGTVVKGFRELVENADFRVPYGNVTSTYQGRTLAELNTLYTSIGTNLSAFYALYDNLVSAHPNYITKTNLGADKDGNPIFQYQFTAPEVRYSTHAAKKPKIIIMANVHGWEKAITYILYATLKEICENWQNSESLEALRWGANIIVVPVINPSGFISEDRKNSNGVDIERNFPTGWTQGVPSDSTYGGAAPLSEPEAVIINNLLANNRDAIQFMSCHSFSGMTPPEFPEGIWVWAPVATDFAINMAKSLIMTNSIQSKKLYPFINADYIGYTDKGAPGGASSYHATRYYGIQGGTFEICGKMYWEPNQPFLSEAVVTCGSNILVNWFLMNIKYSTALYNSRVNI